MDGERCTTCGRLVGWCDPDTPHDAPQPAPKPRMDCPCVSGEFCGNVWSRPGDIATCECASQLPRQHFDGMMGSPPHGKFVILPCKSSWHKVPPVESPAKAQGFEEALVEYRDALQHDLLTEENPNSTDADRAESSEQYIRADDRLRAAHAAEVEEATLTGQHRGRKEVSCGAAKDCTRKPMFCGTHHLEIRDNLMVQARAAGVKEGRRQMAKGVAAKLIEFYGPLGKPSGITLAPLREWLESQSREEAER